MWWLIVPAVGVVGKLIYDAVTEDSTPSPSYTTLEQNLRRLRNELWNHSPRIAILGQAGAGKSSLLKKITRGKVKPIPHIGTETDATTWAERSDCHLLSQYEREVFVPMQGNEQEDGVSNKRVIFVDVPGYDTTSHPISSFREHFPFQQFDAFLFVLKGKVREADEHMFDLARRTSKPICVIRSFADGLETHELAQAQADLSMKLRLDHQIGFVHYSNRTGVGVEQVKHFCRRSVNLHLP